MEDTIIVFTARGPDRILREGGSQAWAMNAVRARQCRWLVCTQNRHHPDPEFSDASEPHGTAFLVGRIASIDPCIEPDSKPGRWLIRIADYARIDIPDAWKGWRNPVRYATLADLGIDAAGFELRPMATPDAPAPMATAGDAPPVRVPLTIQQAKRELAETFGVKPEDVEIIIRG